MSSPATNKNYCVAWFKLAEFIERGEKERALSMYKLLTHTVPDPAFTYQLEGDLLASFGDHLAAKERYITAAQLYCKQQEFVIALTLYEKLVRTQRIQDSLVEALARTYAQAHAYERALHSTITFMQLSHEGLYHLIQALIVHHSLGTSARLYSTLAQQLILNNSQLTTELQDSLSLLLQKSPLAHEREYQLQVLDTLQTCYPTEYNNLCAQLLVQHA